MPSESAGERNEVGRGLTRMHADSEKRIQPHDCFCFSNLRFSAFIRGLFRSCNLTHALNQAFDLIFRGVAGAPGSHEAFRSQP